LQQAIDDFDQNFTDLVVGLISQTGYSIEYVMDMGIIQFNQMLASFGRLKKLADKEYSSNQTKIMSANTFGETKWQ
jgi:hypothetical protein